MQKIISLFQRNYGGDHLVRDEIVPGAEWVVAGEGVATRKWDGTCCKIEHGQLYKRYENKHGKTPPVDFIPAQDPDPVTGHWPGWLSVLDSPQDRWFKEGLFNTETSHGIALKLPDGTYELVGPKVNGNPEEVSEHMLIKHSVFKLTNVPRTFDALREFFVANSFMEGIVWYHHDGRMVKIKLRDFGLKRTPRTIKSDGTIVGGLSALQKLQGDRNEV